MLEMNRITLVKVLAQIFFGRNIGFRLDYSTTLQLERMCENWTGGNWDQTKEERRSSLFRHPYLTYLSSVYKRLEIWRWQKPTACKTISLVFVLRLESYYGINPLWPPPPPGGTYILYISNTIEGGRGLNRDGRLISFSKDDGISSFKIWPKKRASGTFTRMQSILMFRVGHSRNSGKYFLFNPKSWALKFVKPASYPGQFALSKLTRGGLEPSAIGEFSREAWQVTSNPKSPRTTGNEAAVIRIPLTIGIRTPSSTGKESEIQYLESRIQDRLGLPYMGWGQCFGIKRA